MEDIINELVKIESIAKDVTASIEQSRKELPDRIRIRCASIQNEIDAEFKKNVGIYADKCFNLTEERISKIRIEAQRLYSQIEDEYYKNRELWEQEIFDSVIKI